MINFNNVFIERGKKLILKNINFKIDKNEKIFIIGSSGSGKTTLINSFLEPKTIKKGKILINNFDISKFSKKELRKQNSNYGFISQKDFFINWESVYFNIKNFYPNYKNSFFRFFNIFFKKDKEKILLLSKKLKIQNILYKNISDISGGEKQRVKILLLLLKKPSIIFADEPTSSLDIKISKEIIKEIYSLENSLLIWNIHKLDLIPNVARRIIGINKGKIIFDGSKKNLTKKIIKDIYE